MTKPAAEPAVHTLASLQSALGAATLDEALALVDGHTKAALVAEGRQVATPRISTDAARIYGQAYDFVVIASDEALDHLPAFSKDFLRVAVWAAAEGERKSDAVNGTAAGEAAKQAAGRATADKLTALAETKRDQLHTALVSFAAGDGALLATAASAYGSVTALGDAIRDQTALVRGWRTSGSKAVKAKVKVSRLNDAWLAAADKIAKEWDQASTVAAATRSRGAVTQTDVDYLDGVNLNLLETLVRWFESGHAGDPAIPRLSYNSLRTHTRRSHHAAPPASAPTTTPAS